MYQKLIALTVITTIGATSSFMLAPSQVQASDDKSPARAANTRLERSPITTGFWSWPRKKLASADEVATSCRDSLAIQLSNGRYLTLKLGTGATSTVVSDEGRCTFNRDTQVERCELTVIDKPNQTQKGFVDSRYSIESDGTLKMSAVAKTTEGPGAPSTDSFTVFPVKCPDDIVHELLTKTFSNK